MAFETSCSTLRFKYDVFLGFRGKDTRNNFIDHLYTTLVLEGINTFKDNDEIERGENIDKEIEIAIQQSQVSVIVFSKGYASSKWCLDELVMIMECTKTTGLVAIPVFYDVDTSDVSEQSGSFSEAFSSHEKCFNKEEVDNWRDALRKASNLAGMVLGDRSEVQFIQAIVKCVRSKLNRTALFISSYLVGVEGRAEPINRWLQDKLNGIGIGIIYGIGGIGKTTMAKIVYNYNCNMFDSSCFLSNVRETIDQPNGLVVLQQRLLKGIKKRKRNVEIDNADEGIQQIMQAIYGRRVLIVLDDVDSSDQFDAIVRMQDWCCYDSKIIITTRNERVLKSEIACMKFQVNGLGADESLQLFSWHAFRQAYPVEEYKEQSEIVVRHCGGHPLALEVLGSCLSGLDRDSWERALKEPEKIDGEGKIQRILKISYDSLKDNRDKNLFLDIACFFMNKGENYVCKIVETSDSYRPLGLQDLVNRCLIYTVDNKLMMHQLVRDMGREIVRQESENLVECSRIWRHKDAFSILSKNIGTKSVKSFVLDQKQVKTNSRNVDFRTDAFKRMSNLTLLHFDGVRFNSRFEDFPKGLEWLSWHRFPLKCLPNTFPMEDLIVIDMKYSNITHIWKGTQVLKELRVLDLSHCHDLVRTPDFFGLSNLETLMLKDCINLVEVHESIGVLQRFVLLNLSGCISLKHLPEKLGMSKSLETLVLSGCSKLMMSPELAAKLESLKFLEMDGIVVNQLQSASNMWSFISWLPRRKCPSSTTFSLAFLPRSLVKLSLRECNLLDENLPRDFSYLPLLESLDLSYNPFHFLPESIENLTKLRKLYLHGCQSLQSLPELPRSLEMCHVKCRSLEFKFSGKKSVCDNIWRKLELITDDNMNMIKDVGLFNVESKEGIQVEMFDLETETTRGQAPLQILHECRIFSIFLPGSDIPHWFSHQSPCTSLSFVVSPPPGHRICGFNLCVVYESKASIILDYKELKCSRFKKYWKPLRTCMMNGGKKMDWLYAPTFVGITESYRDMLWLSHWRFAAENGDLMHMESGDKVAVYVASVFYSGRMSNNNYVKKCGIHPVYISENEESSPNYHQNLKCGIACDHTNEYLIYHAFNRF